MRRTGTLRTSIYPLGPPDVWLDDSDRLNCGAEDSRGSATPGHTRGHFVFEIPDEGLLFTGDHVLPRITPSIGFEPRPDPYALTAYLRSLQLLMARPTNTMLPAHGADRLRRHGASRGAFVASRSSFREHPRVRHGGSSTAYEVARQMRWTRRLCSVDDLNTVHAMSAVLEVLAHLEVLGDAGFGRCDATRSDAQVPRQLTRWVESRCAEDGGNPLSAIWSTPRPLEASRPASERRGSQCTSTAFAETLVLEEIAASIGSVGDAHDKGLAS